MLLSVIIPVYNVEKTLKRAVESVQSQLGIEKEIILVNDGSTDKSGRLCDELSAKDSRITVIHQLNAGLSAARNTGIENSKGDFISFLDSDDYFADHIFLKFVEALSENPLLDLFIFNVARVNKKEVKNQKSINSNSKNKQENISLLFDYSGIDFYAWNKIYRKNLFSSTRFPVDTLYEDMIPSYYTTRDSDQVITTDETGIYYIHNEESIVASSFQSKQYDNVTERIRLLEVIQREYPTLEGKALERVLDGFLSTGYKLSSSYRSIEIKEYKNILKRDVKKYLPQFKKIDSIPFTKMIALRLLLQSYSLYRILYKWYLGK